VLLLETYRGMREFVMKCCNHSPNADWTSRLDKQQWRLRIDAASDRNDSDNQAERPKTI
jgi:hypothetical protein